MKTFAEGKKPARERSFLTEALSTKKERAQWLERSSLQADLHPDHYTSTIRLLGNQRGKGFNT
jgi:hypothetical protein